MDACEERLTYLKPAGLGELADQAIWIFTDNLIPILKHSLPYMLLFFGSFSLIILLPPQLNFLRFVLPCLLLPFLHFSLAPVSRIVWRDFLKQPFPEADKKGMILKGAGRFLGTLGLSLLCLLSSIVLFLPYAFALLVPAIIGIERATWLDAYRKSKKIVTGNPSRILGILLFSVGLVILLGTLGASIFEFIIPWILAALEIKNITWILYVKVAIYSVLASLALPLLEVSLVLLYHQTKIYSEGIDISSLLDKFEARGE